MATLTIGDKSVNVDDAFLKLSPEEQNATVEEIASQIGAAPVRELPELKNSHGGSLMSGFIEGVGNVIKDGFNYVGDVARGNKDVFDPATGHVSDEAIKQGADLGMVFTPAVPGLKAVGSGPSASAAEAPKIVQSAEAPVVNEVAAAAQRADVPVPRFIASESMPTQRAASVLKNVPLAGDPLVKSYGRTLEALGEKAKGVADDLGGATVESAGEGAASGVKDWIKTKSSEKVSKLYDDVDQLVNQDARVELANTSDTVSKILAKRQNARIPGDSKAVNQVLEAIQSEGLNYQGVKDLRTNLGEMLKSSVLPEGMSGAELKQIYGALTEDLKTVVGQAGGDKALKAFNRANSYNAAVSRRRESLTRIVGRDGNASPAQVYDRIIAAAGGTSRADSKLLFQAKKAMEPEEWSGVVSAAVSRLGRDVEGKFSPDRFVTDFNKKLSPSGRTALFGHEATELHQILTDIGTISSRMKKLEKQFGNPSGTAQNMIGAGIGGGGAAAAILEPTTALTMVGAMVGGRALASLLSKPTSARVVRNYAKVLELDMRKSSATTRKELEKLRVAIMRAAERTSASNDNLIAVRPAAASSEPQEESQRSY